MTPKDKILSTAAYYFLKKERLNDTEEEALRLATCEACPIFDKEHRTCGDGETKGCGCYMDAKVKMKKNLDPKLKKIVITHCPMGKWGDIETANIYRKEAGLELLEVDQLT